MSCGTIGTGKAVDFWWAKWSYIYSCTLQAYSILTVKNILYITCTLLVCVLVYSIYRRTNYIHPAPVVQSNWLQFQRAVSYFDGLSQMGSLPVLQTRKNMGSRVGPVMLTVLVETEGGIADGDLPLDVETYALALRRGSKVVDAVWKLLTSVSFHFSSIISTFRDLFQQIGVRRHDQLAALTLLLLSTSLSAQSSSGFDWCG